MALAPSFTFAAPPVTHLEYDANGNNTKVTNGLGNSTTLQYDTIDRLIEQSQPHPTTTGAQLGTIGTQYNALDAVTGVTDPRSLSTSYTKNAFGDVLTLISPDTGSTTNTYDNAGNLKTRTDTVGRLATYTYDATNRLKSITYKPSATGTADETITLTYDAGTNGKGHLTGMTDLSGSTTWSYDGLGRVTRKQQRVGNQIYDLQMQYDAGGRLSRLIYPSTRYVDYGYNVNGQVNQISVDGNIMVSAIQYHPTGTIKSWLWGNGQTFMRNIDSDGRPIQHSIGDKLQVTTYDAAGRISQLNRALAATPGTPIANTVSTYQYDHLDRLTDNVTPTTSQSYQYDLSGNRTALIIGANSYPYSIDTASNKLTSEAGPTARTYTYHADGSIAGNGQDTYTYYNSGRLKQVTRTIGTTPTNIYALRYNGLGQFVHRTNGNVYYLYDGTGHLLGEYNSSGNANQETVYLGDTPVLTLRSSAQERTADNNSTATTAKATLTGTWTAATTVKGFYGSNYHSHIATPAGQTTTDNILYTITPTASQSFKVYVRWVAQATNATNASYTIAPNTTVNGVLTTPTVITVDQTQNGGTWNYLGSYTLNTANQLTVTLSGQGNGMVIADAIRIVPDTATQTQANTYSIYTDHLDTPREIRNYANQMRWTWYPEQAEAFGANLPNENPNVPALGVFSYNLRFPGQLYDPASGLSYNYYRDYNSRTGRYIESDPIGLMGGINTFGYVDANPLWYVDPEGLKSSLMGELLNKIFPESVDKAVGKARGFVCATNLCNSPSLNFDRVIEQCAMQTKPSDMEFSGGILNTCIETCTEKLKECGTKKSACEETGVKLYE
jgi:RHS repeat-associated protein